MQTNQNSPSHPSVVVRGEETLLKPSCAVLYILITSHVVRKAPVCVCNGLVLSFEQNLRIHMQKKCSSKRAGNEFHTPRVLNFVNNWEEIAD